MKKLLLILFFLFPSICFPHFWGDNEKRHDKLELIMRLQDLRTVNDGTLVRFLSDPDPIVRERAIRAYGSIQDTSVIQPLVDALSDNDPNVQITAAFAIGQTASQLSRKSKQTLEHDLIWVRLDKMSLPGDARSGGIDRLIEEIGKFGTEGALNDLLLRFGNVYPRVHSNALIMSIARFAIRNITSDTAIQYLLTFIKPADSSSWQAVYALQRVGDHSVIRSEMNNIIQLQKHNDPFVRMNLATLLGKIKDEKTSLEPLQKLAEFDSDWRVKVNAFKALGNFQLLRHDDLVDIFRRSFFDQNPYIALTALSTFGNSSIKKNGGSSKVQEAFSSLERIAKNDDHGYLWQLQGEAAIALAKLSGKDAVPFIRPKDYSQQILQSQLLQALGESGASEAVDVLLSYVESNEPMLFRAALEGLQTLCSKSANDSVIIQKTYDASLAALKNHDVAVVTTAASMLGDSLFLRSGSITALIETLSRLHVPDDIEAMQEIISTLGKSKSDRAIPILTEQLQQHDRSVALAAASALKGITGREYLSSMVQSFEPSRTDFDFAYLDSLKGSSCVHQFRQDTICVTLETLRGDIVLELYKNYAPFTVMSFLKLATRQGFYRGLSFHRVVPNFVIQGGDPHGDGWGGPGYSLRSEFSPLTYETGMLGMASAGKDTEGSQFFITQSPQPHLDGRYTIFGKVVSGMDVVNKIQVGDHIFDIK